MSQSVFCWWCSGPLVKQRSSVDIEIPTGTVTVHASCATRAKESGEAWTVGVKPGPAVKARCCFCGRVHDSEECPDDRAAG